LIPTEVAALMSVTGIAAMYRLLQRNILVDSGHALDTAGEITTVLLDKTGTITAGNRRATSFTTVNGTTAEELLRAAVLSSLDDPTPEGTSTIQLAQAEGYQGDLDGDPAGRIVAFSAQTRLSGRDLPDGTGVRKGAESAVLTWLKHVGTQQPKAVTDQLRSLTHDIALTGGTPLVVAIKPAGGPGRLLGVIHLTDVVKAAVPTRIEQLRSLGVRTVMITGDNPLTAQAIGRQVGVDESVGDATPEDKLALITDEQAQGHFVAMSGDGTNDAPALAQADVGVAMNSATAAAKKAANMVILDDDPTRLVEIIETGRRQQATRGALVTFNMANDIVRYCALFPALFAGTFPGLDALNILRLHSPASAVVSTLIYSTVVIICLIPLAMWGVPYRMSNLARALSRNLLYYGLGGIVFAAVWIKGIDLVVGLLPGY
jgi:K+-transporting ATPase ATPase B chain